MRAGKVNLSQSLSLLGTCDALWSDFNSARQCLYNIGFTPHLSLQIHPRVLYIHNVHAPFNEEPQKYARHTHKLRTDSFESRMALSTKATQRRRSAAFGDLCKCWESTVRSGIADICGFRVDRGGIQRISLLKSTRPGPVNDRSSLPY